MGGYFSGRRDGGPLVEDGWKLDLSHCIRKGLILPAGMRQVPCGGPRPARVR
jgi:hypothetical protein